MIGYDFFCETSFSNSISHHCVALLYGIPLGIFIGVAYMGNFYLWIEEKIAIGFLLILFLV